MGERDKTGKDPVTLPLLPLSSSGSPRFQTDRPALLLLLLLLLLLPPPSRLIYLGGEGGGGGQERLL